MKIEVLVTVAGKGYVYPPGEYEVKDEIGEMLVKAGHARKKASRSSGSKKKE